MLRQPTPTPLTIITGFLGAGKTTLLNRILHAGHGLRVAVLVNDFGAINIDSQLVVGVEGETVNLSNGCICCTIRNDLIKVILDLLQRSEPPEYIIVETSGVSDPIEVAQSFQIIRGVEIDSILTMLDAEQILSIDQRYAALATNQVLAADVVLVNKVDLVSEAQLQQVHEYVRRVSPGSRIVEATQADVPLELLLDVGAFDLERFASRPPNVHFHDEIAHHNHSRTDHTRVFDTWSWHSCQPVSYLALERMLQTLPESIYRAKGIFFFADHPERKGVLQVVGKRVSLTFQGDAWNDELPCSQMVVIGAAGEVNATNLNERIEACLAINAPQSEMEYITNSVIEWLRQRLQSSSSLHQRSNDNE